MAHHLAEIIAEAEAASGDAKAGAKERAADLILRLWERRHDLHEAADPLGSCREAIDLLAGLRADRSPWFPHRGRGGLEGLLADLFDSMARVVVGGILLTRAGAVREVAPAEEAALSPEELDLREQLAWWAAAITPETPSNLASLIRLKFVGSASPSGHDRGQEASVGLDSVDPLSECAADESPRTGDDPQQEIFGDPEDIPPEAWRPEEQVTEALERLQTEFGRLVDAWKAGAGRD